MRAALLPLALAMACSSPPPAPEGLDASTSYLVREFYQDDATFQAGVQGFMGWYAAEGYLLVGEQADSSNTDSFTIGDLSPEDVAHLPLVEEILIDGAEGTIAPRDLSQAKGVVSLAEMECTWQEAEAWLLRSDQNNIFPDDFEGYERSYVTARSTFADASASAEYDPVEAPLEPFAEGFDGEPYARTLLQTVNIVDPSPILFADMVPYEMQLDLRHGLYEVEDEDLGVLAILTFNTDAVWDEEGSNGLVQSYSVEINVQRPNDRTLRMLAVWAQPIGGGLDPDSPLVLNYAVNKSLSASEQLSAVCAGEEEVPDEE
ncbi:MAG: hypothetical protein H6741_10850 [Alphaproteobacteria bacterium]|nr:hypothetical protein [Alphaproteobacteria bacterium]MCB9793214.1 hypothetical protein [Alphaproteobacteria bacterium]